MHSIGIDTIISYNEAAIVLQYKIKSYIIKNNPSLKEDYNNNRDNNKFALRYQANEFVFDYSYLNQFLFICMMGKTGDNTLKSTFSKNQITSCLIPHSPYALNKEFLLSLNKKIKITTAVRDPLSICISGLYEGFALPYFTNVIFSYNLTEKPLFEDCGDVQKIFDERTNYNDNAKNPISGFMENFSQYVTDLSKYEFDKDKGYTIVKEGNLEIFVYQLEKMNDIVKEMSDWIGETPFDEWTISNDASSKWIADSYKQAQKELKFSKEFFDRCYNNSWVEHFYSKEDIEKFKARWIGQVMD